MALDPAISLQAGQGVTPLMQPMDVAAKGIQLQGGMLQMQAQKMQNQQLQQQIQDAQDFRNTFKTAVANGQDPVQALSKSPSPIAQKYLSTILDMRQKGVKLQGDQYDLGVKKTQGMGYDILAATSATGATPQSVAAVVQRHAASGDLPPDQAQEMMQELQSIQGPDALKKWGILQGVKTHVAKDVLGMFTPQTKVIGNVAVTQDALTGKVTGSAPVPGMAASEIGKFAVDLTGKPDITPEVVAKWNELHPNALNFMGPNGLPKSGGGTPGAPATPGDLSNIPSQWQSTIKALGSYNILLNDFPARPGPGQLSKAQALQMLTQAYPNYSVADAKTNYDFINSLKGTTPASAGGVIFNAGKMLGHAAELADLSQKIGNSSNLVGHIGDVIAGPVTQTTPLAGQWNFMRGKLMDEANKLAVGGVPDAKSLAEDVSNMKMTDRLDKQLAIIQQVVNMGMESVKGIRDKRDNIMGANSPGDSMLSQDSLNNIAKVYKYVGQPPPDLGAAAGGRGYTNTSQANSPNQPIATPQTQASQPSAYKLGQVVKGYVFLGGDPTNQNSWKKQK